ncbi:SigE family RNA polymerase sigma factor [Nocardioides cynanchi]|uniref:SigE family RNA polymerase sigma factor n=1 Tax=Nocardioides cynanchi TaxID=2558918 RepID=UPI001247684C|nr:SigE family RNA polymerase sigma factor [Nocardioides cynanchi]
MSAGRDDFEAFVAARYDALLRTAYLLTGDHHDAEDLLQQSLVKAVGAWGRIVGDPEPYVRTILVRQNVSRWRRRRWREVHTDLVPDRAEQDDGAEDRMQLQQALALLAPRQRAVIVLRYYEDLTEAQTAEALGIAVGTVKSQARDALKRLRESVPDLAEELVSP